MKHKFKINKSPYNEEDKIFAKGYITFNSGLTVLVGCNGSGKSTMINDIKYSCEKSKLPNTYFDDRHDGGSNRVSFRAEILGEVFPLIQYVMQSEGERIEASLGEVFGNLRRLIEKARNDNQTEYFVFLDAIDSGYSIDNVLSLKDAINLCINDAKENFGIDVYFIISANEYELANGEDCIDVTECKHIKFKSYDDFKSFIIASAEKKRKRYNEWNERVRNERNKEEDFFNNEIEEDDEDEEISSQSELNETLKKLAEDVYNAKDRHENLKNWNNELEN